MKILKDLSYQFLKWDSVDYLLKSIWYVVLGIIGLILIGYSQEHPIIFWVIVLFLFVAAVQIEILWNDKRISFIELYERENRMKDLKNRINEILSQDGYRSLIDEKENQIKVNIEGRFIIFEFYKDDPTCIRIAFCIKEFKPEERVNKLNAANYINANIKYAYVVVYENQFVIHSDVYISFNMDVTDNLNIKDILYRHLSTLFSAEKEFELWENSLNMNQFSLN
jgi:hypothetical protein